MKAVQGGVHWLLAGGGGVGRGGWGWVSPFLVLLFKNLPPCDHDDSFDLIFFSFRIPLNSHKARERGKAGTAKRSKTPWSFLASPGKAQSERKNPQTQ